MNLKNSYFGLKKNCLLIQNGGSTSARPRAPILEEAAWYSEEARSYDSAVYDERI